MSSLKFLKAGAIGGLGAAISAICIPFVTPALETLNYYLILLF